MEQNEVLLKLSSDEALVIFEFLSRFDKDGSLKIEDQSEERALWNLHCLIEESLPSLFNPDYKSLLAMAQTRLKDKK